MLWAIFFWAWTGSEALILLITRTRRGKGDVRDRGTLLMLWCTILLSITACEWLSHIISPTFPHATRTVALALLLAGLAIRWTAVLSLGKAFSANVAIRESQTVNRSGLYKLVRHPSYLGLFVIFLAIGLHARNLVSLACAFVPTRLMLLHRIHVEEVALISAFGHDYESYISTTKRLIPWIY